MNLLLQKIKKCTHCEEFLPFKPKPILNFSFDSRVVIIGQAPGVKAHESGKPWNDASGERLREWLGVDGQTFYNPKYFAIVPMGFCYPGKGKSGDLPPRPECSEKWMDLVLTQLKKVEMKILIGAYSQAYFLKESFIGLTESVKSWEKYEPKIFLLPHPSPRNNIWLKKNLWFEKKLVPKLRQQVQRLIGS